MRPPSYKPSGAQEAQPCSQTYTDGTTPLEAREWSASLQRSRTRSARAGPVRCPDAGRAPHCLLRDRPRSVIISLLHFMRVFPPATTAAHRVIASCSNWQVVDGTWHVMVRGTRPEAASPPPPPPPEKNIIPRKMVLGAEQGDPPRHKKDALPREPRRRRGRRRPSPLSPWLPSSCFVSFFFHRRAHFRANVMKWTYVDKDKKRRLFSLAIPPRVAGAEEGKRGWVPLLTGMGAPRA